MFGHNRTDFPYDCTSEFPVPEAQSFPPPPLFIPIPGSGGDRDCLSALRSEMQGGGYTSSGCSSYGGSPTSYSPTIIHRSISTHSLHQNPDLYSSPPPPYYDCGTHSSSVRKVLSTGDLQGSRSSSSPLVNESSIIESMSRASPYSPEEKKERIERYRSKRNLRNFNKKIKYECRKTLADSRPRIRGRFARNDVESDKMPQTQWEHTAVEEDDEDDDNWIHFLDSFSANLMP